MDALRSSRRADALATKRAIELAEGRVRVAYRSTVCLSLEQVHCTSAVPRWHSPGGSSDDVLGRPRDRWLNAALTSAVLHRVAREVGAAGTLACVLVDLPGSQLRDDDLPARVSETLALHRVQPGSIGFAFGLADVTSNVRGAEAAFEALRALGCHVGLNGFGTVLAPVAQLDCLAADFVRVDASLVARLLDDAEGLTQMSALLRTAKQVGPVTVATGVDTRPQADWLRDLGCDLAQGRLFGGSREEMVVPTPHSCGHDG